MLLHLYYINSLNKFNVYGFLVKTVLSFFVFVETLALVNLYCTFTHLESLNFFFAARSSLLVFDYVTSDALFNLTNAGANLAYVYYFPFIYIFILITILAVLFCLTYSINELIIFMFYCAAILVSGYILFFTDSLILFFFSYEMLLVPSFFILYRFAKTRRCIEAAYLMFF